MVVKNIRCTDIEYVDVYDNIKLVKFKNLTIGSPEKITNGRYYLCFFHERYYHFIVKMLGAYILSKNVVPELKLSYIMPVFHRNFDNNFDMKKFNQYIHDFDFYMKDIRKDNEPVYHRFFNDIQEYFPGDMAVSFNSHDLAIEEAYILIDIKHNKNLFNLLDKDNLIDFFVEYKRWCHFSQKYNNCTICNDIDHERCTECDFESEVARHLNVELKNMQTKSMDIENLFISRKISNNRYKNNIINKIDLKESKERYMKYHDEIESYFRNKNFVCVDFEGMPLKKQIDYIKSSKNIYMFSGTTAINGMFCNEDSKVYEIDIVKDFKHDHSRFTISVGAKHKLIMIPQDKCDSLEDIIKIIDLDVHANT